MLEAQSQLCADAVEKRRDDGECVKPRTLYQEVEALVRGWDFYARGTTHNHYSGIGFSKDTQAS